MQEGMGTVKPSLGRSFKTRHKIICKLLESVLAFLQEFLNPCVSRNATLVVHFFEELNLSCGFCAMLNGMGMAYLLEITRDTGVEISVFSLEVTHSKALEAAFSKQDVE